MVRILPCGDFTLWGKMCGDFTLWGNHLWGYCLWGFHLWGKRREPLNLSLTKQFLLHVKLFFKCEKPTLTLILVNFLEYPLEGKKSDFHFHSFFYLWKRPFTLALQSPTKGPLLGVHSRWFSFQRTHRQASKPNTNRHYNNNSKEEEEEEEEGGPTLLLMLSRLELSTVCIRGKRPKDPIRQWRSKTHSQCTQHFYNTMSSTVVRVQICMVNTSNSFNFSFLFFSFFSFLFFFFFFLVGWLSGWERWG